MTTISTKLRRTARPVKRWSRLIHARIHPPTMSVGIGRGLRFDAGHGNPAYADGSNELPVQEALARYLTPGGVLFDIGANVGFFSVLGAKLVGNAGTVYAFEPVPENAPCIRRNGALNGMGNIEIVTKAASDRDGTGVLVLADFAGGAALETAPPPPDAKGAITVDLVRVDTLLAGGQTRAPTVVKIDVEGAEMEVLRGMRETLVKHRPVVICEIDDGELEGLQTKTKECETFLRDLGYATYSLEPSYPGGDWLVHHFVATPAKESK